MNENASIKSVITNLEELFAVLNERFFGNNLCKPVITISPNSTKTNAFGWITTWKCWHDAEKGEEFFEINICAEYLSRPFADVASTMLHEMVHLYNIMNGVKDCSRGGTYHNNKFKDSAEKHGLICHKDEKYGWTDTTLNFEAAETVTEFMEIIDKTSFSLYRDGEKKKEEKKGGKSNSRKYVCPCCGLIVRATKEVKVICADCDEILELEM